MVAPNASDEPKDPLMELYDQAQEIQDSNPAKAEEMYQKVFRSDVETEESMKAMEQSIYACGKLYVKQKKADQLEKLTLDIRPYCENLPKAKTAKIVRTLIDLMSEIEGTLERQIELVQDCVEWCIKEKRTFLRQRVQAKLAALYLESKNFQAGIVLMEGLLRDVKKMDDKLLLVEIHLVECRLHFQINNLPKSKAALTACKTNANAIHCPPALQAEIDQLSGVIHAREKDFMTATSYFFEAFEYFHSVNDSRVFTTFKYMLLTKLMCNQPEEVLSLTGKFLQYADHAQFLQALARAHQARSVEMFDKARSQWPKELEDVIMSYHINDLNDTMLEQNLLRICEPYSKVELSRIAELIKLPLDKVRTKLSEMILDQKLLGTLDQGCGVLVLFEKEHVRSTYENVLNSIKNTSDVLDTMFEKAKLLA